MQFPRSTPNDHARELHIERACLPLLRIAESLAPDIRDMINDPNVIFTREDHTGTARLSKKNETNPQ